MIYTKEEQNQVVIKGLNTRQINMRIDSTSQDKVLHIISTRLYSNPIGSIVREWTSNAYDACIKKGVTAPIIVKIANNVFSVEDWGVGMSPETVEHVVAGFGNSTKEESDKELGYWGLGLKSGFSYASSFNIETRWEGVKYTYVLHKDENLKLSITLLDEEPTDLENGTKIYVKIKEDGQDEATFFRECQQQLAYFKQVYFDVPGINNEEIILHNTEKWSFSSLNQRQHIHINMDGVFYDLPSEITTERVYLPIAINISTQDGVMPTPSREQLLMTASSKKFLQEKYQEVINEFKEYVETNPIKFKGIRDLLEKGIEPVIYETGGKELFNIPTTLHESNAIFENSIIKPGLLNVFDLVQASYIMGNLRHTRTISLRRVVDISYKCVFCKDHVPTQRERLYLDEYVFGNISSSGIFYISYKITPKRLWGWNGWYSTLRLNKYERSKWRQVIKEAAELVEAFFNQLKQLKETDLPPASWKPNASKKVRITRKRDAEHFYSKNLTYKGPFEEHKEKEWKRSGRFHVYGTMNERSLLESIHRSAIGEKVLKVIFVSTATKKKLDGLKLHNYCSASDFLKGNNKVYRRIAKKYALGQLIEEIEDYEKVFLEHFYQHKVMPLTSYITASSVLEREMAEKATENNYWDDVNINGLITAKKEMERIKEVLKPFGSVLYRLYVSYPEGKLSISKALRFDKIRVKNKYYLKQLTNV